MRRFGEKGIQTVNFGNCKGKRKGDMKDGSTIIIGAGFAGMSAGIYAQMNGYKTEIFESHNLPGGLCTAWNRKGYTVDGCVHWLVGSSPKSGMYRFWQEVGIAGESNFIDLEEFMRYEWTDGRKLIFYSDIDKFEKQLLEFSPQDEKPIKDFTNSIRMCLSFDKPSDADPFFMKLVNYARMGLLFVTKGRKIKHLMNITMEEFIENFKNPALREAFRQIWIPEFSMFFMVFTFAFLHNKNAGYPVGGSMPLSRAIEKRYKDLGGVIHYGKRVDKILTENDKAVGVKLSDGTEHRAERVISAADGHTTIFKMLDGKYTDEKIRETYENWKIFPPLVYVGLGVNRSFENEPKTVSGICFQLKKPVEIGNTMIESLPVHIFNQDVTMAPAGKTCLTVMLSSSYEYWEEIARDKTVYQQKKEQITKIVIEALEQRFAGISDQIEMTDVATPLTFERFTGNWKGSFEGWLITPENSHVVMKPMSQTLPGLTDFYMCGQWVEPGGGLPTGVMSGRRLLKAICKKERKKFNSTIA